MRVRSSAIADPGFAHLLASIEGGVHDEWRNVTEIAGDHATDHSAPTSHTNDYVRLVADRVHIGENLLHCRVDNPPRQAVAISDVLREQEDCEHTRHDGDDDCRD